MSRLSSEKEKINEDIKARKAKGKSQETPEIVKKKKLKNEAKARKIEKLNIKGLLKSLRSEDEYVRTVARRSVVAIGKDAIEPLLEALNNEKYKRLQFEAA